MTIDWWTLGFQTVNVVVLVWLLQRFFWRPVAAIIDQRRAATDKALADAKAAQDEAAKGLADIAAKQAGFATERDAILAAAHVTAEAAAKSVLDAAAKEAAARAAAAATAALAEHDAAEAAWTDRSSDLAVRIAGRLASRLQGPVVDTAFLDWLVSSIETMPTDQRAAIAEAAGLEAVTAKQLEPAEQEHARSAIAAAFGVPAGTGLTGMIFTTDPALVSGIELRGPHFELKNSWRADLDEILRTLRHAPGQ